MVKKLYILFALLFSVSFLNAQRLVNDKIDVLPGKGVSNRNAVIYYPPNYSKTKKYPLVIFTHGIGEAGTNVNELYRTGLPRVLKNGYRPSFDFIMVAPQSTSFSANATWLPGILESAIDRWNIDENRVYLTGLSAGGKSIYGSQLSLTSQIASKFAAIVTNAGVIPAGSKTDYAIWKKSKTPLWAIVGARDKSYVTRNRNLVNEVNKQVPGLATLTLQPGIGHGGWDNVYNGKIKNGSITMWEWMYQFTRASKNFPNIDTNNTDNNDEVKAEVPAAPIVKQLYVNVFSGRNAPSGSQWNNWNLGTSRKGYVTSPTLRFSDRSTSGIKAQLSESYTVADNSAKYVKGMAPAEVLRYTSYSMKNRTLTISGLSPSKKYTFEFYASRGKNNSSTRFVINKSVEQVNTYYNATRKAVFSNISPNAQGKIVISIQSAQRYNYLNGFSITETSTATKR